MNIKKLGKTIKVERVINDMSQDELAKKCKLSRNHMGAIERGEKNCTLSILYRISTALNLKISELFEKAGY